MFSMNNKGVYVMDNTPDIQIFPVFDQSAPGVWYDFASIRTESAVVKYPSLATQESISGYLEDCESSWKKKSFNFAYAAYHDDKMVGFIQGDVVDRVGYIRDLFVLPEYQKMRIGHNLLTNAETAAAMGARDLDLVSLVYAEPFYKAHGYTTLYGSNRLGKPTSQHGLSYATLPIFKCTPKVIQACEYIAKQNGVKFDKTLVSKLHRPMFIYAGHNQRIDGYIVQDDVVSKPVISKDYPMQDWVAKRLQTAFDAYIMHTATQQAKVR